LAAKAKPPKIFTYPFPEQWEVTDGDTLHFPLFDLGYYHIHKSVSLRLDAIDAPEKNTDAGKEVRSFVADLLNIHLARPFIQPVVISRSKLDKYKRFNGEIDLEGQAGGSLSGLLIRLGLVVPYKDGKRLWTDKMLANCQKNRVRATAALDPDRLWQIWAVTDENPILPLGKA
jgi:endonuclease YncB( thermonuclease family)